MELLDAYAQTLSPVFRSAYADIKVVQVSPTRPLTRTEDAWDAVAIAHIHMLDGNIDLWTRSMTAAVWFFESNDVTITGTRKWAFDHIMKAHQSSLAAVVVLCKWPEVDPADRYPVRRPRARKVAAGNEVPEVVITPPDE